MRRILLSALLLLAALTAASQPRTAAGDPAANGRKSHTWIPIPQAAKPYTRWWWPGSAVDSAGLDYNLTQLAQAGIGGVEITPIYGAQGNEANEIPFLSARWMRMLAFTESRCAQLGMETEMATGTGWPFGGPDVPLSQAACKAEFHGDQLEVGRTRQKVKRAAKGGEGYVIDHFDREAVKCYLAGFSTAFLRGHTPAPHAFFNDSYEVYGADWTPRLPEAFRSRRGYAIEDHYEALTKADSLRTDEDRRVLSDYRETLGELLLENFTTQWTQWAHELGAQTRNQAHGSPANLLDIYAAVDVPECESFGLSDFGIRGLRKDSGFTRPNFSDLSMLKYASSAAHVSGKRLTSSETFTWLTEHFRTSLSQCKPDLDLMFVSGVNHVFFHGTCYSPPQAAWPGWRFYASVDMSPANPWWPAMRAFSDYIARTQAFLQWGQPDNDMLVYLPYHDMIYAQPGRLALFDIHSMAQRAPRFIAAIHSILGAGYDCDYISDRWLELSPLCNPDSVASSPYSAVIVPEVRFMPRATVRRLHTLQAAGLRVIFVGHFPESEPGLRGKAYKDSDFKGFTLASTYDEAATCTGGRREELRTRCGLSCIRRRNAEGWHYFIANLTPRDVDTLVSLATPFQSALRYNPMTGTVEETCTHGQRIHIALRSGESVILRTFQAPRALPATASADSESADGDTTLPLTHWTLTFPQAAPTPIVHTFRLDSLRSWTELGDSLLLSTMATGRYATTFTLPARSTRVSLELGDVREWARVVVNGREVATLFAVPFACDLTPYVAQGENRLEIYVANLAANRIAEMDRRQVPWRCMKEINVVDLNYRRTTYAQWTPVASGLLSPVSLRVSTAAAGQK